MAWEKGKKMNLMRKFVKIKQIPLIEVLKFVYFFRERLFDNVQKVIYNFKK